MTATRILISLVLLLVGAAVAFFFISRNKAIKRAYESIERTDEYWDAGALLFEPRYLEAEKAISEVDDIVVAARLRSCLTYVSSSRKSREMGAEAAASKEDAISRGLSRQLIAERDALIKALGERVLKLRSAVAECIAQPR